MNENENVEPTEAVENSAPEGAPEPCPGCGEVHDENEVMTAQQMVQDALGRIALEAAKVCQAEPGKYADLEAALHYGDKAAKVMLIEQLANSLKEDGLDLSMLQGGAPTAPAAPATEAKSAVGEPPSYGQYL